MTELGDDDKSVSRTDLEESDIDSGKALNPSVILDEAHQEPPVDLQFSPYALSGNRIDWGASSSLREGALLQGNFWPFHQSSNDELVK